MYTERYMKSVVDNEKGYFTSAVAKTENFKDRKYLLIHGLSDDNVHIQNSLQLLQNLQKPNIVPPNLVASRFIPDENHSMGKTEFSYLFVYKLVTDFFVDSFKEIDQIRKLLAKE
jgi:dipeptidyl aminopeptidase